MTTPPLPLDRGPAAGLDLLFQRIERLDHVNAPIWEDVSALAVVGRSIFLSCDETATVERLVFDPATGRAGDHASFALAHAFALPDGPMGEMDIEGLAADGGYLWVTGSHGLKRSRPKENGLLDMRDIDWDPNRGFLGRLPLIDRGDGVFDLAAAFKPLDGSEAREAAMTDLGRDGTSAIRALLADDPLVGPFVALPSKENGLDVEGLAVRGETVLLGLRGPVLRGHALIVRLEMKLDTKNRLKPRRLADGRRYALQALDLGGQGIRDLLWDGDRLLVLTGAATDLEALQSVVAVEAYDPERELYRADDTRRALDFKPVRGFDHAEGMALLDTPDGRRLLVACDAPRPERFDAKERRLTADLFDGF